MKPTSDYTGKPTKQRKSVPIMIQQNMGEQIQNKLDADLWIKIPDNDIKIGLRQDFNDYELMQEEHLRNFDMRGNTEKPHHHKSLITRTREENR